MNDVLKHVLSHKSFDVQLVVITLNNPANYSLSHQLTHTMYSSICITVKDFNFLESNNHCKVGRRKKTKVVSDFF